MESIEKWLKENFGDDNGYGWGYSSGCGYGDSTGHGDDPGYGSGESLGDGRGHGDGSGSGDSCGSGFGCGYGSGDGRGDCRGYGCGYGSYYGAFFGLRTINNLTIYIIDGIPTIIEKIHKNIAKCKMLRTDLTFIDCYVAKGNGYFAHGSTVKEAVQSLQEKIFKDLDIEETIEKFLKTFKKNKKYKGVKFFTWHNLLTGSCLTGRSEFIKERNLSLNDEYSVDEFISICENVYGKENILKLKERWEKC